MFLVIAVTLGNAFYVLYKVITLGYNNVDFWEVEWVRLPPWAFFVLIIAQMLPTMLFFLPLLYLTGV